MMFLDVSLSYFSVPAGINSFQTRHDGQNLGKVETSPQHFAEDHHLLSFLGLEKNTFFFGIQFILLLDLTSDRSFLLSPIISYYLFIMVMGTLLHVYPSTQKHSSAKNLINVLFFLF